MNFKKIPINKSSYIRLYEDDTFEVHCSAQGPLGANVYHFKRGLLEWKQRRSYSFVSKKYKVTYEWLGSALHLSFNTKNVQKLKIIYVIPLMIFEH